MGGTDGNSHTFPRKKYKNKCQDKLDVNAKLPFIPLFF
jgi:hypothetical protein